MNIHYLFTPSADPDNPNEQQPGTIIFDHRLYGVPSKDIVFFTEGTAYSIPLFIKETNSSTLSLAITGDEFYEDEQVTLTIQPQP